MAGGGGGADASPSGIRPPADPKGPPFDTFSEIHFWPTDPKYFLKAPMAPIYTNFKGERAPKKTRFFCQNFSKSAQKRLFLTVFSKICLRRRKFCQNRGKTVLWESSKNQFGRPKKKKGRQILYPPLVLNTLARKQLGPAIASMSKKPLEKGRFL